MRLNVTWKKMMVLLGIIFSFVNYKPTPELVIRLNHGLAHLSLISFRGA